MKKAKKEEKANKAGRSRISVTVPDTTSLLRCEVMAATAVFKVDLRGGLRTGKTEFSST